MLEAFTEWLLTVIGIVTPSQGGNFHRFAYDSFAEQQRRG